MKIHESAENYLEAILMIQLEKGSARSIDVAHKLEFSKPSVSRAMSLLRENGYINMGKDGLLELTDSGRAIAETIYERHVLLTRWLVSLGVPADVAAEDACRMEHDVSPVTFEKLKEYITAQLPPETAAPTQEEH
ncbi:MAG: metal-dependent transcriptional regulator [Clostridiales bacterium]|nr:metal-dependent transcriptional regulator [Clostridiales bacterium]